MSATAHSVVEPKPWTKRLAGGLVILYAVITMVPIAWIFMTGFKTPQDSISYPPKVVFQPSLEGYVNLFTTRTRQTPEYMASLPPPETWYDELVRSRHMVIAGPSKFGERFTNSVIIGFGSTFLSVFLGTLAAYAFSRFRVPLKDDLMFFILSTRMMPPIAVAIPIFLMYRTVGLSDTHLGMIILYTAVNVSLAVWLLKGFVDEIPREYEEAAVVDGYTRFQAFYKVVLPQMRAGIAPGLAIHILGITLLTLMMGWGLASLAGLMALAVTTLVGLEPWTSFGTNALICVLIPALVSHGVMLFERRLALRNFFGFIFISGFFGAGASVLAASLTISLLLWSGGVYAAHQLVHDYLRYLPLFVFPEAFLNGTMVAALTAFHPDRLLMLQQHRYHSR